MARCPAAKLYAPLAALPAPPGTVAEIPLADWPHYDALSFGEAMRCLRVFTTSPKLAALVVTEINPDHDPEGLWIRQFVDAFSDALRPVAAPVA